MQHSDIITLKIRDLIPHAQPLARIPRQGGAEVPGRHGATAGGSRQAQAPGQAVQVSKPTTAFQPYCR